MARLSLQFELYYNNDYYYIDSNDDWYRLKRSSILPHSPLINYKKYCSVDYFSKLDPKVDTKVISELETMLGLCETDEGSF